ncbi:hypothetical protein [Paenibacillus maysiensis]|uniref:hypothetical protein n=1 Tax=Paenibacillus maysiensis TaxID=1155954 RepID=UPI0004718E28|nr:hypothetical protein [Paenibacillus maysiensis]
MLWRIQQEEQKEKPNPAEIRAIEDAITKVQMNVAALIRENGKLIDMKKQKSDGSLDQLMEILDRARKTGCKDKDRSRQSIRFVSLLFTTAEAVSFRNK